MADTRPEQLPSHVAEIVLEVHSIAKSTELWTGWNPVHTPLVFHTPQVAYVIGHPAPPGGYYPLGSVGGLQVYSGPPLPEMAANTAAQVNGHWCALIMTPDAGAAVKDCARLVLHECFHVYQNTALKHLPRPNIQLMSRYPENDPENNALCVIENRLLARALEGDDSVLTHFLVVRRSRHQRLQSLSMDDLCIYEELSEYNEGTPTYVEVKAGRPLQDIKDGLLRSNIGGNGAGYRRFYYTGAAIALLLDRTSRTWQSRLAEGGKTLGQLIQEGVERFCLSSDTPGIDRVLLEYGYQEVLDAERSREEERQEKINSIMEDLKSGPGILVEIEIPHGSTILFDPTNILVVRAGVRIHTRICGLKTDNGAEVFVERVCVEDQESHRFLVRLPGLPEVREDEVFTVSGPGLKIRAPAGSVKETGPGSYRIGLMGGPTGNPAPRHLE